MNCETKGIETASMRGVIFRETTTCLSICAARVPAATPPYETSPTGLYFHSSWRKSSAFFSGALKPWLYSGMTNANASTAPTWALQPLVCCFVYWRRRGWLGSSRNGRSSSSRSTASTAKAPWERARSSNHRPTGSPTRPGRVLAMTISSLGIGSPSGSRLTGLDAYRATGELGCRGTRSGEHPPAELAQPEREEHHAEPDQDRVDDVEMHVGGLGQPGAHTLGHV